jgi:hypothetical protein
MGYQAVSTVGTSRVRGQEGMALITVMMVMMLVSVLMIGFVAAIVADNRGSGLDRDQTQAYAAAHAGLEKLTSDLSTLFTVNFAPKNAQIQVLNAAPPVVPGFSYLAPDGTPGYLITFIADPVTGDPDPMDADGTAISAGPYQGLKGIITPYDITVTARSTGGAEVRMRRTLQTIQVPVFQFGVFSEGDLGIHAEGDLTVSGRVHTNGHLYLASGDTKTLTLTDRVTAVGEVIRSNLANGFATAANYKGKVNILKSTNVYRDLGSKEGSLVGDLGTNLNEPTWTTLSIGTYNGNIRNGRTGARTLVLPLVDQGAKPIDIIRRPAQNSNEHVAAEAIYNQRFYATATLRILLSDTAADITTLPLVTATAPVPLDGTATVAQYDGVPPLAVSAGPGSTMTTGVTNQGANSIINVIDVRPLLPTLKLGATTVVCTGRNLTLTQFTGCVGTPLSAFGASVTGGAMNTTTTIATLPGAATIDVISNAAFMPLPFFWGDNMTSCTLYSATQLQGCHGVTPATGNLPNNQPLTTAALSPAGTPLINGFIKIEMQTALNVWADVTTEILNLGIAAPNATGFLCADPTPDAIVRLQRLRNNGNTTLCPSTMNATAATNYWPNALYDTREANLRDQFTAGNPKELKLAGVMNYISFDVNNYRRWLAGNTGATGNLSMQKDNGYIVYFSDRRNNRNAANVETGEYGFEDVLNPDDNNGTPNNALDPANPLLPLEGGGEDSNFDPDNPGYVAVFDMYGATPRNVPAGAALPMTAAALPLSTSVGGVAITAPHVMVNRPILFRRALKLVNGGSGSLPAGLTVASENPLYVHGNYNALPGAAAADPHSPASIIADAVTVLSNSWSDVQSFITPNAPASRGASNTGYRFAMVSGKGPAFIQPAGWGAMRDFGTDGGAENYLRHLESWTGRTMSYRGSIISFFVSRQATGSYKCCDTVYKEPSRNILFDTEFLTPSLLPPGTPSFRDVNTLTFRQLLRPNQ